MRGIVASIEGRCSERQRVHRRHHDVERPQQWPGQQRVGQQQHGAAAQRRLTPADDLTAVQPVGQDPAVQGEPTSGTSLGRAEQADGQGGAGELLDLDDQGDVGGLGAEQGDRRTAEQHPEVAAGQWRQVHPQPGDGHGSLTGGTLASRVTQRRCVFGRAAGRSGVDAGHVQLGRTADDELAARGHLRAHQQAEDVAGDRGVLDPDPAQRPVLRVHGRLGQLEASISPRPL